ncbi:MAG: response regulator [Anaerolineae bacterium]|nr:response regulator [Anaerolineae bacterium]
MTCIHSNGKVRILVVEDSPTQALHVQTLLEKYGARVTVAQNGRIGVQIANVVHPDLIILDMQMPEMNGLQACQVLKKSEETWDIPIIMFTSLEDEDLIASVLDLGVVDFIPKDVFADMVLVETLRQMGMVAAESLA